MSTSNQNNDVISGENDDDNKNNEDEGMISMNPAPAPPPVSGAIDAPNNNETQTENNTNKRTRNERNKNQTKKQGGGGGRPLNSYLKVIFDDTSLDVLHHMSCVVRDEVNDIFGGNITTAHGQLNDSGTDRKTLHDENNNEEKDNGVNETEYNKNEENGNNKENPGENREEKGVRRKKRQKHRPLRFKPRSRQSLHMTFFFGGTVLCEIPSEELIKWHNDVAQTIQNAVLNDMKANEEEKETTMEVEQQKQESPYTLEFIKICLFPPRRNNLIVAIFDASPALHTLHDDIRDVALSSDCKELRHVVQRSKERWKAHVTLGNIFGGSKKDLRKLNELIEVKNSDYLRNTSLVQQGKELKNKGEYEVNSKEKSAEVEPSLNCNEEEEESEDSEHGNITFSAIVNSVTMGGPVPEQIELDWNFSLSRR